jgi:hypothetical protein
LSFKLILAISSESDQIGILQELILDLPTHNALIVYRLIQMFQNLIGYGNIDPNDIANEFSNGMINKNTSTLMNFSWNQSSAQPLNFYQSDQLLSAYSFRGSPTKKSKSPKSPSMFNSVSVDEGNSLRQLLSQTSIKNTWLLLVKYFNELFENEQFQTKKNEFLKEMENEKRRRKEKQEQNDQNGIDIDINPCSYYLSCLKVGNLSPLFTEENLKKHRVYVSKDNEFNIIRTFENGKNIIKGGKFEKLVQKLTDPYDNFDDSDIYVFLLTFRTFTEPIILFDALVDRYNTPPPKQNITTERFTHFFQTYLKLIRLR